MVDATLSPPSARSELPPHLQTVEDNLHAMARRRTIYTLISIAAVVAIVMSGVTVANEYNAGSFQRGIDNFFDYPVDMVTEAWEAGWSFWPTMASYVPDLLLTINMALFATVLSFVVSVPLAFVASRNVMGNGFVVMVVRRMLDLFRSFPELIIAMVFLYLMGQSPLPAVIAITIHTIGVFGKLFSEAIENIDNRPVEGLQSVGAGWVTRMRFGAMTQVLPIFLSYGILRLEINVRASTILGFVGAGGIGEALSAVIQWRYGDDICAIIVLLVVTITALDYLSDAVRNRLSGGVRDIV